MHFDPDEWVTTVQINKPSRRLWYFDIYTSYYFVIHIYFQPLSMFYVCKMADLIILIECSIGMYFLLDLNISQLKINISITYHIFMSVFIFFDYEKYFHELSYVLVKLSVLWFTRANYFIQICYYSNFFFRLLCGHNYTWYYQWLVCTVHSDLYHHNQIQTKI